VAKTGQTLPTVKEKDNHSLRRPDGDTRWKTWGFLGIGDGWGLDPVED
jgi:hypothetical protein